MEKNQLDGNPPQNNLKVVGENVVEFMHHYAGRVAYKVVPSRWGVRYSGPGVLQDNSYEDYDEDADEDLIVEEFNFVEIGDDNNLENYPKVKSGDVYFITDAPNFPKIAKEDFL